MKRETFTIYGVMGMHRSGTSLATKTLNMIGLPLSPNLLPGDQFNEAGYFEGAELVRIHDLLLALADQPWGSRNHVLPFAVHKEKQVKLEEVEKELRAHLENVVSLNAESGLLLVKDPRMCLFLPLWKKIVAELGIDLKLIFVFRSPDEVASSLMRRDKLDPEIGRLLWLRYNATMINDGKGLDHIVLRHKDWATAEPHVIASISKFVGLEAGPIQEEVFRVDLTKSSDAHPSGVFEDWDRAIEAVSTGGQLSGALLDLSEQFLRAYPALLPEALFADGKDARAAAEYSIRRDLETFRDATARYKEAYEQSSQILRSQTNEFTDTKAELTTTKAELTTANTELTTTKATLMAAMAASTTTKATLMAAMAASTDAKAELTTNDAELTRVKKMAEDLQNALSEKDQIQHSSKWLLGQLFRVLWKSVRKIPR